MSGKGVIEERRPSVRVKELYKNWGGYPWGVEASLKKEEEIRNTKEEKLPPMECRGELEKRTSINS